MSSCYTKDTASPVIPIAILTPETYYTWLSLQNEFTKSWLVSIKFRAEAGNIQTIPDETGKLSRVLFCLNKVDNIHAVGVLPLSLPEGVYQLDDQSPYYLQYVKAWGMGAYQFSHYKKTKREPAKLLLSAEIKQQMTKVIDAIYLVRNCINTPTEEMGPSELANISAALANTHNANYAEIIGNDLLRQNYPLIHAVGRASDDAPRLIDFTWGDASYPKVTLVGKGVCFDTGGLDLKPSQYMLLMKKDMGGAANVLGLAKLIMSHNLPVRLRVLIPAVENSVSGNAYRPGDVFKSRSGLTVEIGNTDAEGRLVLADALAEAASETPDLLIDMATLTGAARVALGPDLPVVFSNHDELVNDVMAHGNKISDPMWRLPLFAGYRDYINSTIADLNNNSAEPYAGAITAALFLNEFVPKHIHWLHFDIMAWNTKTRPAKPQGGEAMGILALFAYLQERFRNS